MIFTYPYVCTICGHVYNPEKGESLQDLKPGVEFANLPSDWAGPICFASKDQFKKEK